MQTGRKTALLIVSLSILICFATVQTSQAADYTKVGVKVGDKADYTVTATGSGSGYASGTMHIYVLSVSGTTVGIKINGTAMPDVTYTGDVSTGTGGIFPYLIAANLTAGNPVYSGAAQSISSSPTMTIAGYSRTVNEMSYSATMMTVTVSYTVDWDKATGLLVKMSVSAGGAGSVEMVMTSTNFISSSNAEGGLFGMSTTTLLIIVVIGVVVIAGIAVALKRRK